MGAGTGESGFVAYRRSADPSHQHRERWDEVRRDAEPTGVHPHQGVGPGAERQRRRHQPEVFSPAE